MRLGILVTCLLSFSRSKLLTSMVKEALVTMIAGGSVPLSSFDYNTDGHFSICFLTLLGILCSKAFSPSFPSFLFTFLSESIAEQ